MPKLSDVAHLGKAVTDSLQRGAPDIDMDTVPKMLDLSAEGLTDNVIAVNANTGNQRQKLVMEVLVRHLHAFASEVALTTEEWKTAIEFLTKTGQTCSDIRQEFILLSDVFGLSALVDILNHPKPEGATESTLLGPFFVEDAKTISLGESIASEGKGEPMLVRGRGNPIMRCMIDTWETDQDGFYDTQYTEYENDCRGRLYTDANGRYAFRGILPVAYPIPNDGPVGQLLRTMHRHVFRPAHLHFSFVTASSSLLRRFISGVTSSSRGRHISVDQLIGSDAVFGVKSSLIVETTRVTDPDEARRLGFSSDSFHLVEYDFVLLTKEEAAFEQAKVRHAASSRIVHPQVEVVGTSVALRSLP
ncbi:hypothetical protein EHS25_000851 [Saitozyma podzolica]|uniref:Intradiol ring-cleavage dioxygenases domain-containing protein n=1 Tax=Saitozyma podzolica TaxID=1890683 RepID=A0A427YXF3_9TREE|nr:hypothetical protein EHS25_000851 [Saitozyma podzolica]